MSCQKNSSRVANQKKNGIGRLVSKSAYAAGATAAIGFGAYGGAIAGSNAARWMGVSPRLGAVVGGVAGGTTWSTIYQAVGQIVSSTKEDRRWSKSQIGKEVIKECHEQIAYEAKKYDQRLQMLKSKRRKVKRQYKSGEVSYPSLKTWASFRIRRAGLPLLLAGLTFSPPALIPQAPWVSKHSILTAAFTSLSCSVPQPVQVQKR